MNETLYSAHSDGEFPSGGRFISDAPLGLQTKQKGKSVENNLFPTDTSSSLSLSPDPILTAFPYDSDKQWFVLRATYGRVDKARKLFESSCPCNIFVPERQVIRTFGSERRYVAAPLLSNLLFVYAHPEHAAEVIKEKASYINYYYNHFVTTKAGHNPPLTIDHPRMIDFIRVASVQGYSTLLVDESKITYKSGDLVEIIDGPFVGVRGRVARIRHQQRVVVSIGVCAMATSYIPTSSIRRIDQV